MPDSIFPAPTLFPPPFHAWHMLGTACHMLRFTYSFIFTAQFSYFCCESLLSGIHFRTLQACMAGGGKKSKRVIEAKFVLTLSCCSYKLAREQTLWQFHQKLGEFNYGWPTLQMNLVFGALNQNGADRIEVVIVTASERARPCFGHLKGEKQTCNNNLYWEGNQVKTLNIHSKRNRKRWSEKEESVERISMDGRW